MNEDRLVEIETTIAFQEHTIKDLCDTVYNQQKQIDILENSLRQLIDQVMDSTIISPERNLKDEIPPHY